MQKLYLEGCKFRRIARIMSKMFGKIYRYQITMNWIKGFVQEHKNHKRCFLIAKMHITAFEVGPEKSLVLRK